MKDASCKPENEHIYRWVGHVESSRSSSSRLRIGTSSGAIVVSRTIPKMPPKTHEVKPERVAMAKSLRARLFDQEELPSKRSCAGYT